MEDISISTTLLYDYDLDQPGLISSSSSSSAAALAWVVHLLTSVIVPITFSVITVFGIIGNLLVIAVVVCDTRMRSSTTNALITNLAVADLLFIVVCVPFTGAGFVLRVWPFGTVWCRTYMYVIHVTAYVSVYTLVLMALDRYLAVAHPIDSMTVRTERNAAVVIVSLWSLICVLNAPVWLQHDVYEYTLGPAPTAGTGEAAGDGDKEVTGEGGDVRTFYGCFFSFGYVFPLTSVTVLYAFMLRHLPTSRLNTGARAGAGAGAASGVGPGGRCQQASDERLRANRRVIRMIIVVISIFALCWLPWHFVNIFQYWFYDKSNDQTEQAALLICKIISTCLAYTNSCVNPFLYAFLSDHFRQGFVRALCCRSSCRSRDSNTSCGRVCGRAAAENGGRGGGGRGEAGEGGGRGEERGMNTGAIEVLRLDGLKTIHVVEDNNDKDVAMISDSSAENELNPLMDKKRMNGENNEQSHVTAVNNT